jgi:RNA polymerase sigma factor (sigma-70 family)
VTDSDASLVVRVVADDDRSAFELLVRRHQSKLRNFLRRLTGNDAARADDLAQETFLKAYRSIRTYRGTAVFSSWLYRIAYNTFLNDERSRFPEAPLEDFDPPAATYGFENAGMEMDIERALQHLSIRQKAIFDLYYKKGMTHEEIGDALEIPLGTVKSDLRRGLDRLRQYLKEWKHNGHGLYR